MGLFRTSSQKDSPETALINAAEKEDFEGVKNAIKKGANVNHVRPKDNKTALNIAVSNKSLQIVEFLLQRPDVDPNLGAPIVDAVFDTKILKLLLDHPKTNLHSMQEGSSAFRMCLNYQLDKSYEMLVAHPRFDINHPAAENGMTPLHLTAKSTYNHYRVKELLKHEKIQVNLINNEGETALHCAARAGFYDSIISLLKDPRVDAGIANKNGRLPLHDLEHYEDTTLLAKDLATHFMASRPVPAKYKHFKTLYTLNAKPMPERTTEEYEAMSNVLGVCGAILKDVYTDADSLHAAMLELLTTRIGAQGFFIGEGLQNADQQLAIHAHARNPYELHAHATNTRDTVQNLSENILLPALAHHMLNITQGSLRLEKLFTEEKLTECKNILVRGAYELFLKDKNPEVLIALSRYEHAQAAKQGGISHQIAALNTKEKRWHPLTKNFTHEGITLVPITTEKELLNEGTVMKHCVGSSTFVAEALHGSAHFYSLQDARGKHLATLRFEMQSGKPIIKNTQSHFRAAHNNDPNPKCHEAQKAFFKAIKEKKIQLNAQLGSANPLTEHGITAYAPTIENIATALQIYQNPKLRAPSAETFRKEIDLSDDRINLRSESTHILGEYRSMSIQDFLTDNKVQTLFQNCLKDVFPALYDQVQKGTAMRKIAKAK